MKSHVDLVFILSTVRGDMMQRKATPSQRQFQGTQTHYIRNTLEALAVVYAKRKWGLWYRCWRDWRLGWGTEMHNPVCGVVQDEGVPRRASHTSTRGERASVPVDQPIKGFIQRERVSPP